MQIEDQENVHAHKAKRNFAVPQKRQNIGLRELGVVNTNIQVPRNVPIGKVASAAAEIENKALKAPAR